MDTMWTVYICAYFVFSTLVGANLPPKLEDFMPKRSQELGTKFSIFCSLQQGTKPFQFEWYKNGQILSSSDTHDYRIDTTSDQSVLIISSLTKSWSSTNFTCSVRNHVGHDTKSTILNVKGMHL